MKLITRLQKVFFTGQALSSATAILIYLAAVKLLIHLLTANNYGYFGDEFYWLAMGEHLDYGYVDVPPLVAYIGAFWRLFFGASLLAIRLLPALAGAMTVFLAGRLARELGGGRFAQGFTALMVLAGPSWLTLNSWFAYDSFDQLCSVLFFYQTARLTNLETPGRWLGLGLIAGLGAMTKLSMIFTAGAFALAWLSVSRRQSFRTRWPWLAGVIAILLCTPFIVWQTVHQWPLLTYIHNYNLARPHPGPLDFLLQIVWAQNPILLPLWLTGLFCLIWGREGKQYRILGLTFLILLTFFMVVMKMESRMLFSAFFPLLAGGAVWLERSFDKWAIRWRGINWFKPAYPLLVILSGALLAIGTLPLLPIKTLTRYLSSVSPVAKQEVYGNTLPLQIAFRFGWPEMVKEVAKIYQSLPETERKNCLIWAGHYAEAGAIDLLGQKYGLPKAVCNHLSYHFWVPGPAVAKAEVVIMFGNESHDPYLIFDEVTPVPRIKGHPYAVKWERNLPIYICRKPKIPIPEIWTKYANFR